MKLPLCHEEGSRLYKGRQTVRYAPIMSCSETPKKVLDFIRADKLLDMRKHEYDI